jgi:hypothetical protein
MKRDSKIVLLCTLLFSAPCARSEKDAVDQACDNGVGFLISKQDKRGAIRETDAHETAITALSALALAAVGGLPSDETPAGECIQKALSFILSADRQDRDGYFGAKDGSRMYGHGITTLFLAEMLGMGRDDAQDKTIRECCERAVGLILKAQSVQKRSGTEGGWRYTPSATDSDLSVTIWQLMALRAAKNAGIAVPKEAIDSAVGYIKRSFKDTGRLNAPIGFSYEINQNPVWSTAAEGLLALQVCGEYEAREVIATSDWLLENPPKVGFTWFYYGTYYYAQGMYQRGGEHAETALKRVADVLLPLQEGDGSWKSMGGNESNRVYRTAMAILSLSVKFHFLPIYQR